MSFVFILSLTFGLFGSLLITPAPLVIRKNSLLILIAIFLFWLPFTLAHPLGDISWLDGQLITNPLINKMQGGILILSTFLIYSIIQKKAPIYIYLLTNSFGCNLILESNDLIILLICWEIINISTYLLITSDRSYLSAGLKYFYLSALNTTFLLLGLALCYMEFGTLRLDQIAILGGFGLVSSALIIIPLFFKLSIIPFYLWAPDLYGRLPLSIGSWLMIVPKISFAVLLLRLTPFVQEITPLLCLCGLASIIVGSIALMSQWIIKRFIAYSSISNMGYLLLVCNDPQIFIMSLIIYIITLTILLVLLVSKKDPLYLVSLQMENTSSYIFGLCLFSLAGIPPLLGFFSKALILSVIIEYVGITIILIMIVTSVISCLRYLNLIKESTFKLVENNSNEFTGSWFISLAVIMLVVGSTTILDYLLLLG